MKTPIQTACNEIIDELIDKVEIGYMTKIIHIMHKHLETEKQQIIDAYQRGYFESNESDKDSETYYTSTYATNK